MDRRWTTYSRFECRVEGALHPGDNYTWYWTQGDKYGNWGYMPACSLNTSADFDAHPNCRRPQIWCWTFSSDPMRAR